MKQKHLLIKPLLILLLGIIVNRASAQASGPTDTTSPPPASSVDAAKIVCYGTAISMTGPLDPGGLDFTKYHWYKIDAGGNKQEVTAQTGKTFTETSAAPGYYNYQVVTENVNGCTSPISDVFKIFVLPQLSVSITAPASTMCALATNETLLTANVTPAASYTFNYQWTRNSVAIPGATSATYDVTGEITPATVTFGVNVTYALNTSCPATTTKAITLTPVPTKPLITAN